MSEQVNLESVKKVIRDEFRQQKEELTDAVYDRIAVTFTDFMKNMEDGQKGNLIEIKEQIAKINKKVVGWGWFIFILVVWSIIMFFAYVMYHNHYLKTGKTFQLFHSNYNEWLQDLKASQTRGYSNKTRGGMTIKYTDAQRDSIISEDQAGILRTIERNNKK